MISRCWPYVSALLLYTLTGCSNIQIYSKVDDNSNTYGKLEGIPFYIKVPALTQDTKLLKREFLVQIDVTVETGGKSKITHFPSLEPIKLDDTQENHEMVIDQITKLINDGAIAGWTFDQTAEEVTKVINTIRSYKPMKSVDPEVVSNVWALSMVVSPKQYYISNRVPLFGSASSTFKFASDGTLTEATSSITDDTAKTLLGLFPITAKLSNLWGITKAEKAFAPPTTVQIDGKLTQINTLYSLRKVTLIGTTGEEKMDKYLPVGQPLPPLSLEKALKGEGNVQLVSKEIQTDSAKPKGDSKAYQLQGSITPPTTSSTSSNGSSGGPEKSQ